MKYYRWLVAKWWMKLHDQNCKACDCHAKYNKFWGDTYL